MARTWGTAAHTVTMRSAAPQRPRSHRWRCSCGAGAGAWTSRGHAVAAADAHIAHPAPPPLAEGPHIEEHW